MRRSRSVGNITVKWIFMKVSEEFGCDTRNSLEHFGDDPFNPLGTGLVFLYLDPSLLETLQSDGWMTIPEIFRIWTQVAID